MSAGPGLVLLTGATGYVGGRLLAALERDGLRVRCMVRRPEALAGRTGANTEVVAGDALDAGSVRRAMEGVTHAYYLVHALGATSGFEAMEERAARVFGEAAAAAGVQRIVYLGGLGDACGELSPHLRSRQRTGEVLRASGVQTTEFRASIVIGSGSLSFEMIRALVERLPVMITPRWVSVTAQPIAIDDAIAYLRGALDLPAGASRVFEIGGPDRMSYEELMQEYARQRGLRRVMIRVPFLTPRLSSLWLGLVTPLYARVGRKLIDSIRHPTVVTDTAAAEAFALRPMGVPSAIARALANEDRQFAATRWSDALSSGAPRPAWGGVRFGNRLIDSRSVRVRAPAAQAFAPVRRIGGATGWYYADRLWRLRGALDLLAGGIGMRRGRRDPEHLLPGDALDFWRVEAVAPDRLLRLAAEMKLPGRAWLEFEVTSDGEWATIRQTAMFDPIGLFGLAYWYSLFPFHQFIFGGMLRRIARAAEVEAGGDLR